MKERVPPASPEDEFNRILRETGEQIKKEAQPPLAVDPREAAKRRQEELKKRQERIEMLRTEINRLKQIQLVNRTVLERYGGALDKHSSMEEVDLFLEIEVQKKERQIEQEGTAQK